MTSKHPLTPALDAPLSLDFSKLDELAEGDSKFIGQILGMIIEQSEETKRELRQSLQQSNFNRIKDIAHKYKSSIHILGNSELVNLFQYLEELCKAPSKRQDISNVSSHAEKACQALINQLKAKMGL